MLVGVALELSATRGLSGHPPEGGTPTGSVSPCTQQDQTTEELSARLASLAVSKIDRKEHLNSIEFDQKLARSSIGSGRGPLKAERRVRFPYALQFIINDLQKMQ